MNTGRTAHFVAASWRWAPGGSVEHDPPGEAAAVLAMDAEELERRFRSCPRLPGRSGPRPARTSLGEAAPLTARWLSNETIQAAGPALVDAFRRSRGAGGAFFVAPAVAAPVDGPGRASPACWSAEGLYARHPHRGAYTQPLDPPLLADAWVWVAAPDDRSRVLQAIADERPDLLVAMLEVWPGPDIGPEEPLLDSADRVDLRPHLTPATFAPLLRSSNARWRQIALQCIGELDSGGPLPACGDAAVR